MNIPSVKKKKLMNIPLYVNRVFGYFLKTKKKIKNNIFIFFLHNIYILFKMLITQNYLK
jgi:hypothetical protein